jgi:hypothetical protein
MAEHTTAGTVRFSPAVLRPDLIPARPRGDVAAGIPHRFLNGSDSEPMRILWIYASVDATRTIIETGVTIRVDAEHGIAPRG